MLITKLNKIDIIQLNINPTISFLYIFEQKNIVKQNIIMLAINKTIYIIFMLVLLYNILEIFN
jgi:hypothetical protein